MYFILFRQIRSEFDCGARKLVEKSVEKSPLTTHWKNVI